MRRKDPAPSFDQEYTKVAMHIYVNRMGEYFFADETEGLNGPYETQVQAEDALRDYCKKYLR